jgi:hypothetical protein
LRPRAMRQSSPGRPKVWSPCACVTKILSTIAGRTMQRCSWICVPSPVSKSQKESFTYMWETSRLRPRPAGSPEATFSARSCSRLPRASASLGQSAAWAALAAHMGRVSHKVPHAQRKGGRAAEGRRVARAAAQDRHLDVHAAAAVLAHLGRRLDARRDGRRLLRRWETGYLRSPPLWLRHRRCCGVR